jgi:hypothetical protein
MTIQTTRRAFIAGAPAIALVATIPGTLTAAPSALRRGWEHALARFQVAEQAAEDFDAQTFWPLYNHEVEVEDAAGIDRSAPGSWRDRQAYIEEHGDGHRVPEDINDRHDELWSLVGDAKEDVLRTPAPDQAALRYKLDYLLEDDGSDSISGWSRDYVAQTLVDIGRLLPPAA